MKVTANISDDLIEEVKRISRKSTITEAITMALTEWINLNRIKELNGQIEKQPLEFRYSFDAQAVRETNRNR